MGQNTSASQERPAERLEGKAETENKGGAQQQQPVVHPESEGAEMKLTERAQQHAVREGEKSSEPATIESENVMGGEEAAATEGQSTAESSVTTAEDAGESASTGGTTFSIPLSTHAEKEERPGGSRFEEGSAENSVADSNWSEGNGTGPRMGWKSMDNVPLGGHAADDESGLLSTQTDPSTVAAKEGLEMFAKSKEHYEPPPRSQIKSGPGLFDLCCKPRAIE